MFSTESRAALVALGLALVSFACGDPLRCPVGSSPSDGICVVDDGGLETDDGGLDAGASDSGPDAGAPDIDSGFDAGCVPSSATDIPDPVFLDSNCDGIDGDLEESVFVATSGALDAAGTRDAPVSSITRGIEIAIAEGRSAVLVSTGEYVDTVVLITGISIYGGYDATTWDRSDDRATVRGPGPVLSAENVTELTTVASLVIEADDADAPGESSIAAMLVRSSAVRFERLALVAGAGAPGASPSRPAMPVQAAAGGMGATGVRSGTCAAPTGPQPFGGAGGSRTTGCGCGRGGDGGAVGGYLRAGSSIFSTASGGARGFLTTDCGVLLVGGGVAGGAAGAGGADGRRGTDGEGGLPGPSGAGGAAVGAFSGAGYIPASGSVGTTGGPGDGGGGGGGGAGCFVTDFCGGSGGSGGGGGAGGCGGPGGQPGGGGGASIALFLWASSPVLVQVDLRAADGGMGGAGSRGGDGGLGGDSGPRGARYPGTCSSGSPTNGGEGGEGGPGGEGGGGGGGTGGPSLGMLLGAGSIEAPGSMGVTIATGAGGVRGLGGGTASTGENGIVQPRLDVGE